MCIMRHSRHEIKVTWFLVQGGHGEGGRGSCDSTAHFCTVFVWDTNGPQFGKFTLFDLVQLLAPNV